MYSPRVELMILLWLRARTLERQRIVREGRARIAEIQNTHESESGANMNRRRKLER